MGEGKKKMKCNKVVFCISQTRDMNGSFKNVHKVKGYLIRVVGGIEMPQQERGVVEYWTNETIEQIRRKYRKNLIEVDA